MAPGMESWCCQVWPELLPCPVLLHPGEGGVATLLWRGPWLGTLLKACQGLLVILTRGQELALVEMSSVSSSNQETSQEGVDNHVSTKYENIIDGEKYFT